MIEDIETIRIDGLFHPPALSLKKGGGSGCNKSVETVELCVVVGGRI